ncbi:MAG: hypothetical protein ACLP9C_12425 [Acidimicrobiales bacterium]
MQQATTTQAKSPGTARSSRASLNPYYVDDVTLTLSDLLRARSVAEEAAAAR